MPPRPGQPPRRRGRLPGHLPGPRPQGDFYRAKGVARQLALWGGLPCRARSQGGQSAASGCVPSPLIGSTVQAAIPLAAGQAASAGLVSAKVAALTEGVLNAMWLTKLKIAAAVLLVGVLAGGAVMLALPALATGQTDVNKAGKPEPAPKEPQPAARKAAEAQIPKIWKERLAIKAPKPSQAFALAVSPDGKTIAVNYGTVTRVLDATTGKELLTLSRTEKWFPERPLA